MKESHPAQKQIAEETSDRDVAIYVSQLLSSLQKICDNRGMHMLSHLLKLAKVEAIRLSGDS
jgi:hypothetical protein